MAISLIRNKRSERLAPYGARESEVLNHAAHEAARAEITSWPGYAPTPLRDLKGLARRAGLAAIWYKDESQRFGPGAFKAIGGAYAVYRVLAAQAIGRAGGAGASAITARELMAGKYRDITSDVTVSCASAGNHARAVAWGAELFGCRCIIYLSTAVSKSREAAIASHGAEIVRVNGTYDDAVHRADEDAKRYERIVVSDTSYPGYMEIPKYVMQGYTIIVGEAIEQLPPRTRPTHVFVQCGVGGLAAAVCAHLWEAWGADRPTFVVVEPDTAACLYRSAAAGRLTKVSGELDTIMGGLAAGEPSQLAWRILERGAEAFMTITDADAENAMRTLAEGSAGDRHVVAGESGAAGLAGALAARSEEAAAASIGLDGESRVLVFGTEGATDPESYERIVGRPAEDVAGL